MFDTHTCSMQNHTSLVLLRTFANGERWLPQWACSIGLSLSSDVRRGWTLVFVMHYCCKKGNLKALLKLPENGQWGNSIECTLSALCRVDRGTSRNKLASKRVRKNVPATGGVRKPWRHTSGTVAPREIRRHRPNNGQTSHLKSRSTAEQLTVVPTWPLTYFSWECIQVILVQVSHREQILRSSVLCDLFLNQVMKQAQSQEVVMILCPFWFSSPMSVVLVNKSWWTQVLRLVWSFWTHWGESAAPGNRQPWRPLWLPWKHLETLHGTNQSQTGCPLHWPADGRNHTLIFRSGCSTFAVFTRGKPVQR